MDFDLIVIGAGPGGYEAALKAAKNNMKTMLIEKAAAGGTCLNKGCIPTKTLLHSSHIYHEANNSEDIGVNVQNISYNMEKIYENKDRIVDKLSSGLEFLFKQAKINYVLGEGKILDNNTVEVNGEQHSSKYIMIATGSIPAMPPIPGIDSKNVYSSDDVLKNAYDFDSVIIIGGGVIGVEFASFYNNLGKTVCIIEAADRILPLMDKDISQNLAMIMKKRGVEIHTAASVTKIENGSCNYTEKGEEKCCTADAVIVATGRKAFTDNLLPDGLDIKLQRGQIEVNEHYQTNIANIYAIGDVTGGVMLAHAATAHGETAVDHMLGKPCHININVIPGCVYTSPEIATVGMTADDAKKLGISTKVGKYIMSANGKSVVEREDRGFIKLVFNEENKVIIGGALMCGRASDLISEIAFATANGLTVDEFLSVIRPHPTFCEGVTEAAKNAGF